MTDEQQAYFSECRAFVSAYRQSAQADRAALRSLSDRLAALTDRLQQSIADDERHLADIRSMIDRVEGLTFDDM